MVIKESDCKIEFTKGKGPGGQHRNKTSSAVKATHIPTGITAFADGRDQHKNKRRALLVLSQRLRQATMDAAAASKKSGRDHRIHNTPTIRTYDFKRNVVKDHRTKKTASIKNILEKAQLDLLRE